MLADGNQALSNGGCRCQRKVVEMAVVRTFSPLALYYVCTSMYYVCTSMQCIDLQAMNLQPKHQPLITVNSRQNCDNDVPQRSGAMWWSYVVVI